MQDKHACFAEACRVLHPGGRLVVCAWLARAGATPNEVRYLLEPICREGRLAGLGTAQEYRQWMVEAGLHVEQMEDVSTQVQPTWTVASRRLLSTLATKPQTWRYLLDSSRRERIFAVTVGRMWLAYRMGALRYGIFSATRL
jgi:tocopherol O-methyltransferase